MPARLTLEDGSVFEGAAIGAPGTTFGEIVFNTCTTGYQEILTDPSYQGQIVLMTYPEIGNYGVNAEDFESGRIQISGLVVRRLSPTTSSWRANSSLQDFLLKNGVSGIQGVDTRSVTRKIRTAGAMRAGVTTGTISHEAFLEQIRSHPPLGEQDLVMRVTAPKPYVLRQTPVTPLLARLAVVDYGIKKSILTYLQELVAEITVVPANATLSEILALRPQGVLLSNGPGDPAILTDGIQLARDLIASGTPTFGICLGHQILALACGARVGKMRFGHHGGNHPVKDLESGRINITSQNHGYAILYDEFPHETLAVTHVNLNDQTIAGIRHKQKPVASVQFHPEASPGPHDGQYLFEQFMREILEHHQMRDQALERSGS
ncbi:MAG: glutamine-hydrolyzing carbamoyl-phosphate synthase small subunit [Vampirovibrionales bacterium]|nr:glutamine-hydrolyzing carbamoyl-phosphate synthase small subunit [Vampirovibrionales bacterium]